MLFFMLRRNRVKKRYMRPDDYKNGLRKASFKLALFAFLHVVAVRFAEMPETTTALSAWWDSIWLTWATLTTTGYGDMSSATVIGRIATMLFGTLGIIQFAGIAGNYMDYRSYQRELQNTHRWEWRDMTNHILVVGLPVQGTARYMENFVKEIRGHAEFDACEILFLASNLPAREALPNCVKDDANQVAFYTGSGSEDEDLIAARVHEAKHIFVLCPDPHLPQADDITAAIVYRITSTLGVNAPVVAEAAHDRKMPFIMDNGATGTTRATNDYPGVIVTEMLAPGSFRIVGDIFQAGGNELNDYPVQLENAPWQDVACKAIGAGWQLMGYRKADGSTVRFGEADTVSNATHVFLFVPQGKQPSDATVQKVLGG